MTAMSAPKFKVYKEYNGEFKWELRNARDEIIAEAPSTFKQKKKCVSAISQVREVLGSVPLVEVD